MIIGKQPLSGAYMLPSIGRRRYSPKYNSAQAPARKDVASVAGQPVDFTQVDASKHVVAYLIAGQPLPVRTYSLSTDADLDETLANIGCTRLTQAYRGMLQDPQFNQSAKSCSVSFGSFELMVDNGVAGWTHSDRMLALSDYTPEEGEVFMLMLVQDTFSDLMDHNTVFIAPYSDATRIIKNSELMLDGSFDVSYDGITTFLEELRTKAYKGAN